MMMADTSPPSRGRLRRWLVPFAAGALSAIAGPAWAAEAPDTGPARTGLPDVGLEYAAPRDCPGVDALAADLEQRLGPTWKVALKHLAEHLTVTVARAGDGHGGALELVTASGERFSRSVRGTTCEEVVRGIGLIIALAVRARSSGATVRADTSSSSPGAASRSSGGPARGEGDEAPRRAEPGSAESAKRGAMAPPSAPSPNYRVRFGARASLTSGVGPGVTFGPGAFAALELAQARFGLSADTFDSGEVQTREVRAVFRLISARLEGCPWSLRLGFWGALEPCAAGELGAFRAAPELDPPAVTASEPKSIVWGAVGLLGRLVLHLRPFVAELEVTGRAPLRRERFFVGRRENVVFEIPTLSAGVSLGAGLVF